MKYYKESVMNLVNESSRLSSGSTSGIWSTSSSFTQLDIWAEPNVSPPVSPVGGKFIKLS